MRTPTDQGRVVVTITCRVTPDRDSYQYDAVDVLRDGLDAYAGCQHLDIRDFLEDHGIQIQSVKYEASK